MQEARASCLWFVVYSRALSVTLVHWRIKLALCRVNSRVCSLCHSEFTWAIYGLFTVSGPAIEIGLGIVHCRVRVLSCSRGTATSEVADERRSSQGD